MSSRDITNSKTFLSRQCAEAEEIIRQIVAQENIETVGPLSWDESPLKPWIIGMAHTVFLYRTVQRSCFYGGVSGHGVIIKRLPTDHSSLTKWSAPLFVDISLQGGGLAFGKQERSAFSVCTTGQLEQILFNTDNPGTRSFGGIEFAFSCGNAVSEKTDVVSIPFGSELDLITVSRQSGAIMGFSFLFGHVRADTETNRAIYGNVDPKTILTDDVAPPSEFQPLYGELNRIVNRVERVSFNPSRTSASLERFSAGVDPDRVLVLNNGRVIRNGDEDNQNGSS